MKIFCYHCRLKKVMTELLNTPKGFYCPACNKEKEIIGKKAVKK